MNDNIIEIKIKLTQKDYIEYNIKTLSKKTRGIRIYVIFAFILTIGIYIYTLFNMNKDISSKMLINGGLGLLKIILVVIIVVLFIRFIVNKTAIKTYKTNKLLQQEVTYRFGENGFALESESGKVNISWDKVYKICRVKDFYTIYISNVQGYVIPRKHFDEVSINQFNRLIKVKLDKKKIKI